MNPKKRKKFDADLAPTFHAPQRFKIPQVSADGHKWSDLSKAAQGKRALVLKHDVTIDGSLYTVKTAHAHGDFKTKVSAIGSDYYLEKHNVATAEAAKGAKSFDKLLGEMGPTAVGATNTMRVLKGTHKNWALQGKDVHQAATATVLASEIGVSEYSRGGTYALANAMSGLYLMKHGAMTKGEFNDPSVGFVGAGDGGAKRLRTLATGGQPSKAFHMDKLQASYKAHAKSKVGKAWSGKSDAEGFDIWIRHKSAKWTQRG